MPAIENVDPLLRCDVRPDRARVVVALTGELDLATVPTVEQELAELHVAGFEHLVLDLRTLDFLDSTGLRLLLRWARSSQDGGPRFSVIQGPPQVRRVIEISGIGAILETVSA